MGDTIKGDLSRPVNLTGSLVEVSSLTGTINASSINDFDRYKGSYEVVPDLFEEQILETENKTLLHDIVIEKVPFYETSNLSNGTTIYIGKEVE